MPSEFAAAALSFRDRHDGLLSIYRLRLQNAMDGVYAVQRRTREGEAHIVIARSDALKADQLSQMLQSAESIEDETGGNSE